MCNSKSKKHNIKRKSRYRRQNDSIGKIRKCAPTITKARNLLPKKKYCLFVCVVCEKYKFMSPVREITTVFINHFNFVWNIFPQFFLSFSLSSIYVCGLYDFEIMPQCYAEYEHRLPYWDLVFRDNHIQKIKLTAFWIRFERAVFSQTFFLVCCGWRLFERKTKSIRKL